MFAKPWLRFALAALVVLGTLGAAQTTGAADTAPVKMEGLRGGAPLNEDKVPTTFRQERDHTPADRDFVQQPPLIPHTIAGYQITLNFNKCMECHSWAKAKEAGAIRVSVTHFRTREGVELDNISPLRYFCTQCHVSQTDAKPLVDNTFQRARGLK